MAKRRRQADFHHVGEVYLVIKDGKRAALDLTRDMAVRFARAVIAGTTIILVAPQGAEISEKLRRVVDGLEYYDPTDPVAADAAARRAMVAALSPQ